MLYLNRKTKHKLLHTKPHIFIGLDLRSSLSTLVGFCIPKIKYQLLQTRPHTEAALRRSWVAKVWGLVLLVNPTSMKKLLQVLVLALLVFPFVSMASSLPDGCLAGYNFSVTTGKSCSALPDCAPGDLFSALTGRSCSSMANQLPTVVQTPLQIINNPVLVQEYTGKLQNLQQQITDIKTQYYKDITNIYSSGVDMSLANGQKGRLLNDDNAKIEGLDAQILQLWQNYQGVHNLVESPIRYDDIHGSAVDTNPAINHGTGCSGYCVPFASA